MSHPFNPRHGAIRVEAEVTGPLKSMTVPLLLDTGATTTLLEESVLISLSYDLAAVTARVPMTTGSTIQAVPKVVLTRLTALGQHRFGFPVLAYTMPAAAAVSGLLGLDFLRDHVLTVNFWAGLITLA